MSDDDIAALRLVQELGERNPDEAPPFPWETHYAAELSLPEVAQLHSFFNGLDTYALHRSGSENEENPIQVSDGEMVYGDTGVPLMYRLLRRWGLNSGDTFYDLGCGCGMPVFTASLLAGTAIGVDLVAPVVDFCLRAARALDRSNTSFFHQDIFATDISQATFIYLACTTFPPEVRARLGDKMLEAKPGTKIVTVTHPLQGRGIRQVKKLPQIFSWSGYGEGYPFEFHLHQRY